MGTKTWRNDAQGSQLHLLYALNTTANVKVEQTVVTHEHHTTGVVVISQRLISSERLELLTVWTQELRAG